MKQIPIYKLKEGCKQSYGHPENTEICDYTLVDDDDFDKCMQFRWFKTPLGYVRTSVNNRQIIIHRLIMNAQKRQMLDHINGNKLDNRKENLRFCNESQNNRNKIKLKIYKGKKPSSSYKGVGLYGKRKKWVSRIFVNNIRKTLGYFNSEQEAALAYNEAALKYYGEFAKLNEI